MVLNRTVKIILDHYCIMELRLRTLIYLYQPGNVVTNNLWILPITKHRIFRQLETLMTETLPSTIPTGRPFIVMSVTSNQFTFNYKYGMPSFKQVAFTFLLLLQFSNIYLDKHLVYVLVLIFRFDFRSALW